MKKLILVCVLCVYALPVQADLKSNVITYLEAYQKFIDSVHAGDFPDSSRVAVGNPASFPNNMALLHMSEVIDAIANGVLNDCCFRSPPDVYENYANAKTEQVMKATTITNPGSAPFQIPPYLGTQMEELAVQLSIVAGNLPSTSTGLDKYDAFAIEIMQALAHDGDDSASNIFGNLMWGWSYIDSAHSELEESFKDYYIYACIVCNGAGYFNTAGLNTTNTATGNLYYDEIVTIHNFPATYNWLQSLAKDQGPKPPLQSSIGLTLQGQAKETERSLTAGVIYPAHCHQAEELYFGLDPMGVSKAASSDILKDLNGYDYDTDSYGIGPVNYAGHQINFVPDLSSQFPKLFMKIRNGDIIYNESAYYHAFNAGERFQFTQWSRLTWPKEGTYFPLNGGPLPPAGVTCISKPQ